MLLLDDLISWQLNEIFTIEKTIKKFDQTSQIVEVRVLELQSVFLLDV